VPASQPQFTLKAEKNKAFDRSHIIRTIKLKSEDIISECLEQCLQDCRCQSFQICQNTKCQLCSSHKEENSSLLHDEDDCVYATYDVRRSSKLFEVSNEFAKNFHYFCVLRKNLAAAIAEPLFREKNKNNRL
jgi:hypothetical protein